MNYYERHLGDYARDTPHLTMLEHGAYTLLMDRYYITEAGIPADQAHRLSRARTKEEKAAVDAVLEEFFTLENGVWIKGRIQEEIAKAQTKIKAAQENGKRGGRPKSNQNKTEEKPSGFSMGYENETQEKAHQTPDTKHQIPNELTHSKETVTSIEPTLAASVCLELKKLGYLDINPSHPRLLSMLNAGATLDEFVNAAKTVSVRKFVYVMGAVEGMRKEAAAASVTVGNFEDTARAKAWRTNDALMLEKAKELGIGTQGKGKFELIAAIDAKIDQQRQKA